MTALACLALAGPVDAATFTVDSTSDTSDVAHGDGMCLDQDNHCSLRAAVEEANAFDGSDAISVPSGGYTLTGGVITISGPLALVGAGADSTSVDGAQVDRVFAVEAAATAVSISHITLQNGVADARNNFYGGVLTNYGKLSLDHVRITGGSGSSGGALANRGGELGISDSLLDHNKADTGGGDGGAIINVTEGDTPSKLVISDSTIAYNSARLAGAINSYGAGTALTLVGSTVVQNFEADYGAGARGFTGGISTGSDVAVHLFGTIVQSNSSPVQTAKPDCFAGQGASFVSDGYTFASDDCRTTTATGDSTAHVSLDDLTNNGGETKTMLPLAGAPVIDAVPSQACWSAGDQRDVHRPQGSGCDAGAAEIEQDTPTASVSGDAVIEDGALHFGVDLSTSLSVPVTVHYVLHDGSATAPADFDGSAGDVTIPADSRTATITVPVVDDALDEPTEDLTLTISSADVAVGTATATGTIVDNDAPPGVDLADAAITEPDGGTADAVVGVRLARAAAKPITLRYRTVDGEATAPGDYVPRTGTIEIPGGQTQATIPIAIVGDTAPEEVERLFVDVVPVEAPSLAVRATVLIRDDDGQPGVSIADARTAEPLGLPATAAVSVVLTHPAKRSVSVRLATADGSATAGQDYAAADAVVTIPAGAVSATLPVQVLPDALTERRDPEPNAFYVKVLGVDGAAVQRDLALVTITPPPGAPPPGAESDRQALDPAQIPGGPGTRLVLSGTQAGLPVACLTTVLGCRGTLKLTLLLGGRGARAAAATLRLTPRRFTLAPGAQAIVKVTLSPAARKALRRARAVRIRITIAVQAGDGPPRTSTETRTLKVRRVGVTKPKTKAKAKAKAKQHR